MLVKKICVLGWWIREVEFLVRWRLEISMGLNFVRYVEIVFVVIVLIWN